MRQTTNYHFLKPDYSDPADVKDLNDNMDLIDSALVLKANLVGGKVPASELPSYVDDVIEGYYYNGAFYQDSGHTIALSGETGKIYIDKSTESCYRWSGSIYIKISSANVDDVQDESGNSLVNNGIAVIPVTGVEDDNGNSLVDASGTAIVQISAMHIEFSESGGDYSCDTEAGDMIDALGNGREVIGQLGDAVYYVGNYDEVGETITFYSYSSSAEISELFGSGLVDTAWAYDVFSLTGGGGGQLPTATLTGDIPSWDANDSEWEITHKGSIASANQGWVTGGDIFQALNGFEVTANKVVALSAASTDTQYPSAKCVYDAIDAVDLPSGSNAGDILVWSGSAWVAKPKWQMIYQPVEYIESTGTQYIDTGIVPQANDIWSLDVQFTGDVSTGNFHINGCYLGAPATSRMSIGVWLGKFQYACSGTAIETTSTSDNIRHKFTLDTLNQEFLIDDTVVDSISQVSLSEELPNIALCGRFSTYGFENATSEKIYGMTYIRGGTTIRELYPCYRIADNEIGLYDAVNKQFYTNAGTGTFAKGADVN